MVIAQETVLRKYVNFDAGHILPPTAILALSAVYAVKSSVAKTLKCEECSLHGRKFVTRGRGHVTFSRIQRNTNQMGRAHPKHYRPKLSNKNYCHLRNYEKILGAKKFFTMSKGGE